MQIFLQIFSFKPSYVEKRKLQLLWSNLQNKSAVSYYCKMSHLEYVLWTTLTYYHIKVWCRIHKNHRVKSIFEMLVSFGIFWNGLTRKVNQVWNMIGDNFLKDSSEPIWWFMNYLANREREQTPKVNGTILRKIFCKLKLSIPPGNRRHHGSSVTD